MNKEIFENAKFYFPFLANHTVEYSMTGPTEITIKLDDGHFMLYDDIDRTIRNLPRDRDHMSELECRKEFSMRLRRLMFRKNINQTELADMTGISQASISNYIIGKSSPSFYNADRIARALDCSIDELRYI